MELVAGVLVCGGVCVLLGVWLLVSQSVRAVCGVVWSVTAVSQSVSVAVRSSQVRSRQVK